MMRQFKGLRRRAARFIAAAALLPPCAAMAAGDAGQGSRDFHNQCSPCHSLQKGRHMTGPSLAGIVGRKAATAEGFDRYSKALTQSGILWTEETLSSWLENPQALVPGNGMTAAVTDAEVRANIVAFLVQTESAGGGGKDDIPKPYESTLNLKEAGPATRIGSIGYCRDTYTLTMENGATIRFWERNLRFKTDSSPEGPNAAKPVLVPGGREGDRAYAVFAAPEEISPFIKANCSSP